jgi:hypothetical protein
MAAEAQRDLHPAGNTVDNLKLAFRTYLLSLGDHAEARFFLRDCWAVPALDAPSRVQQEAGVVLVQRLVEAGIVRGDLVEVDAETLTRVLLGAFAEATLHVLTSGRPEHAMDVVERLIDAFATQPSRSRTGD